MRASRSYRAPLCVAATIVGLAYRSPAFAQDADRLSAIEAQIKALQAELAHVRHDMAQKDAQVRAAQRDAAQARQSAAAAAASAASPVRAPQPAPPPPSVAVNQPPPAPDTGPPVTTVVDPTTHKIVPGTFRIGGITVQLGGFIEAAGIYRTRNEVADVASNFNAIPLANSPLYHEDENRFTARQSRVSLLAYGDPNPNTRLTAYGEADFLGAAPTANSNESNSYNLRLRVAYLTVDEKMNDDWSLHALAGQEWSLLTMNKVGIIPRQENIPLTIDAQYAVGFTWTRQPQFRVTSNWDNFWLAASLESPQVTYSTGGFGTATNFPGGTNGLVLPSGLDATVNNPGGSNFAPTVNYSTDIAPDLVLKAAYDASFGHLEAYGIARFMDTHTDALGFNHNNVTPAGGIGAAALIPVIPGKMEVQLSALAGYGIGRYGTSQLPDATIRPNGTAAPLPEVQALLGVIGHPTPSLDLYGYLGTEQVGKVAFDVGGKGFGYGSPLFVNTGCATELSPLTCTGNTSGITEGTLGFWWRPFKGPFGTLQSGAQYAYVQRQTFEGVGGAPSTNENIMMVSLRYYPFQ